MELYEGTAPYVFVSYAHLDTPTVQPVIEALQQNGYRLWYDKGIYSGGNWREIVAEHLHSANCVLAFISKAFCQSNNCQDEIFMAHDDSCTIIPVYVGAKTVPDYLPLSLRMTLSGYNAIFGTSESVTTLLAKIGDAPAMIACKTDGIGSGNAGRRKISSSLEFSEYFLHSGASKIKNGSIEDIRRELEKMSRLFDSIYYVKHREKRIPSDDIAEEIVQIIKNNGNTKNLLKLKGPIGSYKNRLLQYIFLLLEKEDNGILPFYIDLAMYEKSIEKGDINEKSELESLVRGHFDQIKSIISVNKDLRPIVFIDGIRDFSSGHDRIYAITKNCLAQLDCEVIVSLDTDFTNNHKFSVQPLSSSDFEFFIRITSMNTFNKKECIEFIGNCLETFRISLPSENIDANKIYDRLVDLKIVTLDAYWISTLLHEMLGNFLNPELTISDLYELLCKKELDESQLNSAAQLAFDYEYGTKDFSDSDFYFDVRWKMMRKHRSTLEYLVARYYVLKFEEFDTENSENAESRLRFLGMILPRSIMVFVTSMIRKKAAFENKILKFADRYYEKLNVLEKNQIIYLLGELQDKTSVAEGKTLLQKYCREAVENYNGSHNGTIAEQSQNAFLVRTISIRMIALGDKQIAERYFDSLLYDKTANEVNRAFHLIYYGDKVYIPSKTRLELSDDVSKGKITFSTLCASVARKIETRSFSNMLILDVFTLCSLIQARIDVPQEQKVLPVVDYAKKVITFLDWILHNRKMAEYEKMRTYFQWMRSELQGYANEGKTYSSANIYNACHSAATVKRSGWVQRQIENPENIVEHMYNCWLMAALYLPDTLPENDTYDKNKILNMLLIHDLGEYRTGDIVNSEKEKDRAHYDAEENEVMQGLLFSGTYPSAQNLRFLSECWDDWFYSKDINYQIAKEIDVIQAIYRFCKYYSENASLFDGDDAAQWIEEIYEIKTNTGRGIVRKLILNNPEFSDIVKEYCDDYEYYE